MKGGEERMCALYPTWGRGREQHIESHVGQVWEGGGEYKMYNTLTFINFCSRFKKLKPKK